MVADRYKKDDVKRLTDTLEEIKEGIPYGLPKKFQLPKMRIQYATWVGTRAGIRRKGHQNELVKCLYIHYENKV